MLARLRTVSEKNLRDVSGFVGIATLMMLLACSPVVAQTGVLAEARANTKEAVDGFLASAGECAANVEPAVAALHATDFESQADICRDFVSGFYFTMQRSHVSAFGRLEGLFQYRQTGWPSKFLSNEHRLRYQMDPDIGNTWAVTIRDQTGRVLLEPGWSYVWARDMSRARILPPFPSSSFYFDPVKRITCGRDEESGELTGCNTNYVVLECAGLRRLLQDPEITSEPERLRNMWILIAGARGKEQSEFFLEHYEAVHTVAERILARIQLGLCE